MFRLMLIVIAAIVGIAIVAGIADVRKLWILSERGTRLTGEVLSSENVPRGAAVIRVFDGSRTFDISEPCVGFPCDIGAHVSVILLSEDPSVRVVGNLSDKFRSALLATFLFAPTLFGAGVAYSLGRSGRPGSAKTLGRRLLWFLPVLMTLGAILSVVIAFIVGDKLARFQAVGTISLVAGCFFYLMAFRERSQDVFIARILATVFFGIGTILIVLDFTQGS